MVTINNCSMLTQDTPICKFSKELTDEHTVHTGELDTSKITIEAWEVVRAYAFCSLAKSEKTFEYYRDLTNYELFDMEDSAQRIKANIENHVKKDVELSDLIVKVSKSLHELQVKLHDANNAACAMRNCLQSTLSFKDDKMPKQLKDVIDKAKELSKGGKQAAEAMVKVAGIHTFSDLEKLEQFGTDLTSKLNALGVFTDQLMNAAKTDMEQYQNELLGDLKQKKLGVLKQLNEVEFKSFGTAAIVNAEKNTLNFICKEECEPIECVEAICMSLGSKESEASNPSARYSQNDMD